MDSEIINRLNEQDKKLEAIYRSVQHVRRYLFWMLTISLVVVVLPLIGYIVIVPRLISIYSGLGAF